jgi:exodeoxyribonuclease III
MKRSVGEALNPAYHKFNADSLPIPKSPLRHAPIGDNRGLTFIAWNVGSLRSMLSKTSQLLTDLYVKHSPAVLGIMETKISASDEAQIEGQIKHLLQKSNTLLNRMKLVFSSSTAKKGYSGTLLIIDLEKTGPFTKIEHSIQSGLETVDKEGRIISGFFEDLKIHCVLCYSPNSGQNLDRLNLRVKAGFDQKLSDFCKAKISDEAGNKSSQGLLLMGDLNVAYLDEDIYNVDAKHIPKSAGTTIEERESFNLNFLKQGFIDLFKKFHPNSTGWFTYWSVRASNKPKNRGLRLDYTLWLEATSVHRQHSPVGAMILDEFAPNGDHAPVGVVFSKNSS